MHHELAVLTITAASIGFFHTMMGPDHYLPFIVMSRARNWSLARTACITFFCGVGHVLSSVLLGVIGIALGISINRLELFESFRGGLVAWILMAFGFGYFAWGMHRALRNRQHKHWHAHGNVNDQIHKHTHSKDHSHAHGGKDTKPLTPWILFAIFVFGPCEPLIPLLMYPAAKSSIFGLVLVTGVFAIVTIMTMLSIVILLSLGVNLLPVRRLERYTHALAGIAILLCGVAIQFLGI